jgi:membrane-associated phospholipid phosphatase
MIEQLHHALVQFDYSVWYYVNTVWRNGFMDLVLPFFRNQWTWVPLYLFLLIFMLMNFGKNGIIWCLFFLLTFAISDQLSAHLFKEIFHRLRPCNQPALAGIVYNIVPCGSGYSFPSSHASNHFALALFAAASLQGKVKGIWTIALLWAFLVSYAQVYVGVHFPLDVICGGMLGVGVGMLTGKLFHLKFRLVMPELQKN